MKILNSGAQELGLALSDRQLEQFKTYYRELTDWNGRLNLTAITGYKEVQIRHFLDSLTVISGFRPAYRERPLNVIDIGTGAGMPGLPLKITLPHINLTLLEATARKTRFLENIVMRLGLKNVAILTGRAEEIARQPRYREKFDVALSRALAPLPVLAELTLPFCTVGGYLIAQKKGDIKEEIEQSRKAMEIMGGSLSEVRPVALTEMTDNRSLVIIDKIRPTPPTYPRHPGIPLKRPLKD